MLLLEPLEIQPCIESLVTQQDLGLDLSNLVNLVYNQYGGRVSGVATKGNFVHLGTGPKLIGHGRVGCSRPIDN